MGLGERRRNRGHICGGRTWEGTAEKEGRTSWIPILQGLSKRRETQAFRRLRVATGLSTSTQRIRPAPWPCCPFVPFPPVLCSSLSQPPTAMVRPRTLSPAIAASLSKVLIASILIPGYPEMFSGRFLEPVRSPKGQTRLEFPPTDFPVFALS